MGITKNNKGFSLIELSIVLIIIGLLVAGITGGASLIKSAQLRAILSEARGYRMAVNAYYTAADYLPGDDPVSAHGTATAATDQGDDNGRIEAHNASNVVEGIEAWNDMLDSDFGVIDMTSITLPVVVSGTIPAITQGNYLGNSKYPSAGWTFDYSVTTESDTTARDVNSNILVFTGATVAATVGVASTAVEFVPRGILSGLDAYSVDKKADDSELTTGSIIGMDGDDSAGAAQATKCDEDETTTNLCGLAFKIDL